MLLSLSDLEKKAKAGPEIDYSVPGKNNNPEDCTISFEAAAGAAITEGAIHVEGNKYKIKGIQNFCEDPEGDVKITGCDPYNCHKRV